MPRDRFDTFLGQLRRAALRREGGCLSDGELLERYVRHGDEAAFEGLVRQHGPMVLGVCRRVLGNHHDAEDAFQATFLVLARKAASVRPCHRVGNWLHGVAYRTALEARRAAARRRRKEASVPPREEMPADGPWAELSPVLDRELSGLPEKYRAPLVLCDLEGKTRREAAQKLGWREGTLSGRLARARVLLARRMGRYGIGVAGGALGALLGREAAAGVPGPLVRATVEAAARTAAGDAATLSANVAALVQGVNRAMCLSKLKVVALGLLVAGAVGSVGVLSYPGRGTAQDQAERALPPAAAAPAAGPRPAPPAGEPEPPHVIEPPDELRVTITKTADMPLEWKHECLVRPDGTVSLGDLGELKVAGRTADAVEGAIVRLLKRRVPTGRLSDKQLRRLVSVDVALANTGKPPLVETRTKEYIVNCSVVRVTADGKDLGELGKGELLSMPRLGLRDNQEGSLTIGGDPFGAAGGREVESSDFSISLRVTVREGLDDRFLVDARLVRTEPEKTATGGLRVHGWSVRGRERVKLGEPVRLVEKDGRGEPLYLAVVRVASVKDVVSHERAALVKPAEEGAARVGQIIIVGNETVMTEVIRRQIPLCPGQVLTYPDLKAAERNLEKTGLFRVEPDRGIRPTVKVVDSGDGSGFKDIVVTVEEKPAAGKQPRK
jgi:RNA polymerase sigma factor (sigma-70 family)